MLADLVNVTSPGGHLFTLKLQNDGDAEVHWEDVKAFILDAVAHARVKFVYRCGEAACAEKEQRWGGAKIRRIRD